MKSFLQKKRILQLAKEGVISEINNVSEKIHVIEKKMKRSPESKNVELWGVAIEGYQNKIKELENELIEISGLFTPLASAE